MRYLECPNSRLSVFPVIILVFTCIFLSACGQSTSKFIVKGEEYLAKRKFHDALMQFRAASENDSDSAAAHWGMARSLENLGQFNDALDELRKTVELDETNLHAKAKLGNYFLLVKPPLITETEDLQRAIIIADPNFIEGHILQASIFAIQNRPENEVVAKVNEAIAIDPARTETYLSLSRYYISKEKFSEAETAIKQGIAVNQTRALGVIEYGRFLTYANRLPEAETQFLQAISIEPSNIEAHEEFAKYFVATKQFDRAESEYRTLVQIQDNSPESRLDLAEFYTLIKRPIDAVNNLTEIIATSPEYARARYRLGQVYLEQKDTAKVNEQLTELFKINDNDSEAFMLRARLRLQESKPEEAIDDLESILKKTPSQRDALYYIAQAKLAIGQIDQARAFIADIERFHPNFLKVGLLRIQAEFTTGNADGAFKMANELLAKVNAATPNAETGVTMLHDLQAKGWTARGLAQIDLKKLPDAQADLQKALAMTPDSAAAMVNLAKVFVAKGEDANAIEMYEKALIADAQSFDAVSGLVTVSIRTKQTQAAHARLEQLIDRNAGRGDLLAALHYLNADLYGAEKNTASQEAELMKSISLDENYLPAYSAFAALLAGRNQTAEAIAQYQTIVAKKPSAPVYTLLGMLEDALTNTAAAEQNYRKALELAPDSPIAANNLAWLLAENQGNLDEALQLASASVGKNQSVAGYYDTLGWVYFKKGLYPSAVEQLRKAVAIDEKSGNAVNPGYRVRLGEALAAAGDKASARREVETSLKFEDVLSQQEANDARRVLASL